MTLLFRSLAIVGLAGVLIPISALAQTDPAQRTMTAVRLGADDSIVLDGILDEPTSLPPLLPKSHAWDRVVPATDFIQQEPTLGGTPTERTEVRILFDGDHLYMGVICYDSEPDKLLGNTMKRDEFLGADDRFMWTIDTFLDERSGYFFEMNPSGLMADSLMGTGGGQSREWDGIWNAKVLRTDIGWVLEIDIPFRTLNFDPNAVAWGINFQRTIRRKNEENLWTGYRRNQGLRRMSNAGRLLGIENVSQGKGLDIKPYGATSLGDAPGAEDPQPLAGSGDVGVDLFYNLTPSLRANLTLNTDFAETEVDQRLVNLTRFPLFFPEKRDFFLDGATFFDFYLARSFRNRDAPVQPFFSRRIGLSGGRQQRIDVGTKLTGQAGNQDIGILYVRTGEEVDLAGEDFAVVRVKRRVLRESSVGGIYTSRRTRASALNPTDETLQTAGADFRLATSSFRGSNNLELEGFFLWNTDRVGDGNNKAYGARLNYPNDIWNARLSFNEVQEDHGPAIGFTPRTGYRQYAPSFRWAPRPDQHAIVRQLGFGVDADLRTDIRNVWLTREFDFTLFRMQMHSQDSFFLAADQRFRAWSSRLATVRPTSPSTPLVNNVKTTSRSTTGSCFLAAPTISSRASARRSTRRAGASSRLAHGSRRAVSSLGIAKKPGSRSASGRGLASPSIWTQSGTGSIFWKDDSRRVSTDCGRTRSSARGCISSTTCSTTRSAESLAGSHASAGSSRQATICSSSTRTTG